LKFSPTRSDAVIVDEAAARKKDQEQRTIHGVYSVADTKRPSFVELLTTTA
jgi:hypothetical protein